jgi:hypothetical protein
MNATKIEKMEIALIGIILAVGGVVGTMWMLKALYGSLSACAMFTPYCPII